MRKKDKDEKSDKQATQQFKFMPSEDLPPPIDHASFGRKLAEIIAKGVDASKRRPQRRK
jgi:hypothetical protein